MLPGGLDDPADAPSASPGLATALREAREGRGLSLQHVAGETRLPVRALAALEGTGSDDDLPEPPYDRYFLREYARYLGVSDPSLMESLEETPQAGVQIPLDLLPAGRPPRRWPMWALAALSVGVLITLAGLRVISPRSVTPPTEPAPAVTRPPAQTNVPPTEASPAAPRIRGVAAVVTLSAPCWIQATVDGQVTLSETFPPGKTLRLKARRTLDLTLGNAGGARLRVNGKRFPTGSSGEVVRLSFAWEHGRLVTAA